MAGNRKNHIYGIGGDTPVNKILTIVNNYVKKISQSGISVSEAILFGSWARGSARTDSDIDVCIVSSALGKDLITEIVNLRRLAFDIDSRIEPMPFSLDDIKDKFNPLAQEINQHGIRIAI
jgi:predicted nucleotidyltransferase